MNKNEGKTGKKLFLILPLILISCSSKLMEDAKRSVDSANAMSQKALSENPIQVERNRFEIDMRFAKKAFDEGEYREAVNFAGRAEKEATNVYNIRLEKRKSVEASVQKIKELTAKALENQKPWIDYDRLFGEIARLLQEINGRLVTREYDSAQNLAGQAIGLLERHETLFEKQAPQPTYGATQGAGGEAKEKEDKSSGNFMDKFKEIMKK